MLTIFNKKKIQKALDEYRRLRESGCLSKVCKECEELRYISENKYTCKREELMDILLPEYIDAVKRIDKEIVDEKIRKEVCVMGYNYEEEKNKIDPVEYAKLVSRVRLLLSMPKKQRPKLDFAYIGKLCGEEVCETWTLFAYIDKLVLDNIINVVSNEGSRLDWIYEIVEGHEKSCTEGATEGVKAEENDKPFEHPLMKIRHEADLDITPIVNMIFYKSEEFLRSALLTDEDSLLSWERLIYVGSNLNKQNDLRFIYCIGDVGRDDVHISNYGLMTLLSCQIRIFDVSDKPDIDQDDIFNYICMDKKSIIKDSICINHTYYFDQAAMNDIKVNGMITPKFNTFDTGGALPTKAQEFKLKLLEWSSMMLERRKELIIAGRTEDLI